MSFFSPETTETLLEFELSTNPNPPRVSPKTGTPETLALTFVANAPGDAEVYCTQVKVEFDVAQGAEQCLDPTFLTCGGANLGFQFSPEGDWTRLTDDPYGTVTFIRPTGVDPQVVTQGYMFEIYDIPVSPVVGTAQVTVTETSSREDPTQCTERAAVFELAKFPTQFRPPEFEALETSTVDHGGSTHLHWRGDPSASYEMSWDGRAPVSVKGQSPWPTPRLNEDTQFTLTVSYQAEGHKVTRNYYVLVQVRSTKLAIAADYDTIFGGASATLFLTIEHATECQLHGGPKPVSIDPKQIVDGKAQVSVTPPSGTTDYYLSGRDVFSHQRKESNTFRVAVIPVAADLIFIKTANTQDKIEIHVADAAHGYQQRAVDVVSAFDAAEGPNGTWLITNFRSEVPAPGRDLGFIKTRNTPDGCVVVSVQLSGSSSIDVDSLRSGFAETDGPNGTWLLLARMSPYHFYFKDLGFIKTKNTPSRRVEVYYTRLEEEGGLEPFSNSWTSLYPASDPPQGMWLVADMTGAGSRPPDLVFIQTIGTENVELSYATSESGFKQKGGHWVTDFDTDDAANGTWTMADMTGDGRQDLVFVKTRNTASERIEVYFFAAADGYGSHQGGPTEFDVAEGPNGTWQVAPWR